MTTNEIILAREKKKDQISLDREKIKFAKELKETFSKELTTSPESIKKDSRLKIFWRNIKNLL